MPPYPPSARGRIPQPAHGIDDPLAADLASLRISRDEPAPHRPGAARYGKILLALALFAALGVAAFFGYRVLRARIFKTEVAVTEITLVSPAQASIDLTSTGYVVAQTVAKIGVKSVGRVTKVGIHEGERTKAGQVLFELDSTDQKSAIAAAQAKVIGQRARANAARARAQVSRANVAEIKTQWERTKKLVATGALPPAQADDLLMRMKGLQAQVVAADADAGAADAEANALLAEVSALQTGIGNLTIAAPIDGTAVTKAVEVGDVVGPTSTLVELADFATLMVETDVPEGRLSLVKPGAPAEISLDAFPGKRFRGAVVEVNPRLNRSKATATVKVMFRDAVPEVLPEMAARVSFLTKALEVAELHEQPKKVVPSGAIVERGGLKQVFVLENGTVRMVQVTLGAPFGAGFELIDGPSPGTRVVKDPPPTLADGQSAKEKST